MANQRVPIISVFNHKGGVAKTTSVYGMSWELASLGKRVMLVDLDPQYNLTQLILHKHLKTEREYVDYNEQFFQRPDKQPNNIHRGLQFVSQLTTCQPVHLWEVIAGSGLLLLPGHPDISEYEEKIGIAMGSNGYLEHQYIPGLFTLIQATAAQNSIDIIVADLSPSIGPLNKIFVMSSDYLIVPCAPDFFSFDRITVCIIYHM